LRFSFWLMKQVDMKHLLNISGKLLLHGGFDTAAG